MKHEESDFDIGDGVVMKRNGFTLIELLVVIAILAILAIIAFIAYNKFVKHAECGGHKEQHTKVVNMAKETYAFCSLNGSTYMNIGPGYGCKSQSSIGMTAEGVDATGAPARRGQ